ncbi:hypothetical protein KKC60_02860, partial [Patescibacteria group bacterium]|nr:hypothetical protein [Patescibacteria group bacterium]
DENKTKEEDFQKRTPQEKEPSRLTNDDIREYAESEDTEAKPQDVIMQWQAPEYIQVSRPQQWYILFAIIGIALVVYAFIVANYLFALIVVILAVVLNTFFHRKPKDLSIAITREGITVENNFYPYGEDLESFWILYNPPDLKTLSFGRRSSVRPTLSIQLEEQNPLKIRETLLNYLPEDVEKEENPVDSTFRRWGF